MREQESNRKKKKKKKKKNSIRNKWVPHVKISNYFREYFWLISIQKNFSNSRSLSNLRLNNFMKLNRRFCLLQYNGDMITDVPLLPWYANKSYLPFVLFLFACDTDNRVLFVTLSVQFSMYIYSSVIFSKRKRNLFNYAIKNPKEKIQYIFWLLDFNNRGIKGKNKII